MSGKEHIGLRLSQDDLLDLVDVFVVTDAPVTRQHLTVELQGENLADVLLLCVEVDSAKNLNLSLGVMGRSQEEATDLGELVRRGAVIGLLLTVGEARRRIELDIRTKRALRTQVSG
jgi:hypothetical protein